jgi:GntR family transcriptional regulator of vanillate catabolism
MTQASLQKLHLNAAIKIRELILQGRLAPGTRITEAALSEMLGLSRTPVRQALPALEKDGLLTPVGKRGFAVRAFTHAESLTALETRGTLEGLAAKIAAERGLSADIQAAFHACLAQGDAILADRADISASNYAYGEMNARFHRLLLQAADRPLIAELVERCAVVPFVSPATIAFGDAPEAVALGDLVYAHRQHHYIVEALERRESSRAEMLLREHATIQRHSMDL